MFLHAPVSILVPILQLLKQNPNSEVGTNIVARCMTEARITCGFTVKKIEHVDKYYNPPILIDENFLKESKSSEKPENKLPYTAQLHINNAIITLESPIRDIDFIYTIEKPIELAILIHADQKTAEEIQKKANDVRSYKQNNGSYSICIRPDTWKKLFEQNHASNLKALLEGNIEVNNSEENITHTTHLSATSTTSSSSASTSSSSASGTSSISASSSSSSSNSPKPITSVTIQILVQSMTTSVLTSSNTGGSKSNEQFSNVKHDLPSLTPPQFR